MMKNKEHKYILKSFLETKTSDYIYSNYPEWRSVEDYIAGYSMQILKKGKFINPPKEFISDNEKKYLSDLINNVSIEEKDDLIRNFLIKWKMCSFPSESR